uniref:Putative lipocalin-2 1 n=1 Tax=Amblyomma triste TaxID=251400 RepID=A0A023G9T0_AMBTT
MTGRTTFFALTLITLSLRSSEELKQDSGNGNNDLDIIKVLNTSQPQWLYYQTYDNAISLPSMDLGITFYELARTCIYNKMTDISKQYYNFTLNLMLGEERNTLTYVGIYDTEGDASNGQPSSMKVYNETGGGPFFEMKLGYFDTDGGCSVFFVTVYEEETTQESPDCELYVPHSKISTGPSDGCMQYFNSCCNPSKKYKPYKDTCTPW